MKTHHHMSFPGSLHRLRILPGVVAIAAICAVHTSLAAEHPEHPTDAKEKAAAKSNVTLDDVAAYVEKHVKKTSAAGVFAVKDEVTGETLSLTLDKVHRERLSQVAPGTYFVCADFKTADGSKVYDVDLFVQGTRKNALAIVPGRTTVHKEDGKPRYNWALNEATGNWEQKAAEGQPPPASAKSEEHPEHPKSN